MVSLDVNMLCVTAVIRIVYTLHCLAVNADMPARVRNCARKAVTTSLVKALAAGIIAVAGMFSPYHDIALAAAVVFVIGTVAYSTG